MSWWLVGLGGAFLAVGLLILNWLTPMRQGWLRLAAVFSSLSGRILMTVVFAGVIAPTALVLRLIRKQPIARGQDRGCDSYWRHRRAEEFEAERMERQF